MCRPQWQSSGRLSADPMACWLLRPSTNHGVPGGLKNAIDWLSRPFSDSALDGKVAAVIGASPGLTGTVRSQVQLRQVFASTNTHVLLRPEVLVAHAHEKFDGNGQLTDTKTRELLRALLERYVGLLAQREHVA